MPQGLQNTAEDRLDLLRLILRNLLISEVDRGLDQRKRRKKITPHLLRQTCQSALGHALCLIQLRLGFSVNDIGEPLNLGQIHLAVLQRASREFPGFGGPQHRQRKQRLFDPGDHCRSAMALQLDDVFASETARTLEKDRQHPIQLSPVCIHQLGQSRPVRRTQTCAKCLGGHARLRS